MLQFTRAACLVGVVALGGCGLAKQAQIREEVAAAAKLRDEQRDECRRQFPDRLKKPVMPRIKCVSAALIAYHEAKKRSGGGSPHFDLVRLMTAKMAMAGERFDSGIISETQFEVESAAVESDYLSAVRARINSTSIARSAEIQAEAASAPVTCNRFGNSVTCF